MLEIRLLGQFNLRRNGTPLSLASRPAQSLLAYLVLNPGVSHRREELAGLLAPDLDEGSARNVLRHALWRIRKTLGQDPTTGQDYLNATDLAVTFDATSHYWLDAAVVTARVPPDAPREVLVAALEVYAGDLLPGFYDDWIFLERKRIETAFESKMRLWLERQAGAGCWDDVLEWGERWIALGHSPESAYRALMLAHAARGDGSRVTSVYQRCAEDLRNGLGVGPAKSTQQLYEQLVHGEGIPVFTQAQVLALPAPIPAAVVSLPPSPGPPPFKGLEPFDVGDACLFFGREALTAQLVDYLQRRRLLIVVGASGCGKSSLVRAGLVPALTGQPCGKAGPAASTRQAWTYHILTPTGHPLHALAEAVTGGDSVLPAAVLADDMAANPLSLTLFLLRQAAKVTGSSGDHQRTLLVVDQFEEVFTLCPREEERVAFIANLMQAVSDDAERRAGMLRLVMALRADFYAQCAAYPALCRALETSQQYIGGMDASELRRCIEGPISAGGWQLEPGLVNLLVRDAGNEPGALPLLSHALLETWRVRSNRLLTLEGYASTGGVHGAIARTADAVYAQFDPEEQTIARRIFLRLTALGDGMEESRRRVAQDDLAPDAQSRPLVKSVLHTLAAARLITLGKGQVEVAHEALIREWPVLRSWLAENQEGIRLHHRLMEATEAWEASGHDTADLYRGARLAQTAEWASCHPAELNAVERTFLAASQSEADRVAAEREARQRRELRAAQQLAAVEQARAQEQQRSNRQLRRRALLLVCALVCVLAVTAFAMVMWRQARQSAEAARRGEALASARELAASAAASLDADAERSILLALEAIKTAQANSVAVPLEAEAALHHAVQTSRLEASLTFVGRVAVSPDGMLVAESESDSLLRVWSVAEILRLPGEAQPRYALPVSATAFEFSPDARLLAVGEGEGRITLYAATTGTEERVLADHGASIVTLRFSADSERLVATDADEVAQTWITGTGDPLIPFSKPPAQLSHVDISPDGTRIAARAGDLGIFVWDPQEGARKLYVIGHEGLGWGIAFCGSNRRLAVGSGEAVRLWDVDTGLDLLTFSLVDSAMAAMACSPDGTRLATVGAAGAVRIWDTENGKQVLALQCDGTLNRLAFSADSTQLITYGVDGAVKLWNVASSREVVTISTSHGSNDVAFSADGSLLAAAVGDAGAFAVWSMPSGDDSTGEPLDLGRHAWQRQFQLVGHENLVTRVTFGRQDRVLATGSLDETVRVWELGPDRAAPGGRQAIDGAAGIADMAFSPDGNRLAAVSGTKVWMWRVAEGGSYELEPFSLRGVPAYVSPLALAWQPDGGALAVGLSDGSARVVDALNGSLLFDLQGHVDQVLRVAFSLDGRQIATASADGTALVWNIAAGSPQPPAGQATLAHTLRGRSTALSVLTFSPDDALLVTAGPDGIVDLWDAKTGRALFALANGGASVTDAAFSPDGRFLATSGDALRVYLIRLDDLVRLARQRVARGLTEEERDQYLHAVSRNGATPAAAITTAQSPIATDTLAQHPNATPPGTSPITSVQVERPRAADSPRALVDKFIAAWASGTPNDILYLFADKIEYQMGPNYITDKLTLGWFTEYWKAIGGRMVLTHCDPEIANNIRCDLEFTSDCSPFLGLRPLHFDTSFTVGQGKIHKVIATMAPDELRELNKILEGMYAWGAANMPDAWASIQKNRDARASARYELNACIGYARSLEATPSPTP